MPHARFLLAQMPAQTFAKGGDVAWPCAMQHAVAVLAAAIADPDDASDTHDDHRYSRARAHNVHAHAGARHRTAVHTNVCAKIDAHARLRAHTHQHRGARMRMHKNGKRAPAVGPWARVDKSHAQQRRPRRATLWSAKGPTRCCMTLLSRRSHAPRSCVARSSGAVELALTSSLEGCTAALGTC